ncbi:hypothetical protein ASF88_12180 [Leifsonia sp. Leaf336]|nr:hypothetical protein ASF88_12180 [Leifsonia sp. Leaf336]
MYLPLAREIESDLRQHAQLEYLWEPEFRDLTSAYCTALAREELYAAWIDQMESVEEWARPSEGRVSSPAEEHLELLSRVAHLAEALGLTPALRDEVREAIAKARTRIELRRQRAAKKPSREELLKAIRDANYPGERNSDRDGLR